VTGNDVIDDDSAAARLLSNLGWRLVVISGKSRETNFLFQSVLSRLGAAF